MRDRKRLRLKDYDYSQPGAYFVTMCTKDREPRFGEIVGGQMRRNDLAVVVQSCWDDLPNHYPNVGLDEFVIMPNHVHGIVIILEQPSVGDGLRPSPTRKYQLSEIVRAFKTFSARRINEMLKTPGVPLWQRSFYDHIIRDNRSMERIRDYIRENPQRWSSDKENAAIEGADEFDRWMNSTTCEPERKGAK